MAGYPRHQGNGLAGRWQSIFSSTVPGGCFFFDLYELLQPTRFNNPGIGAYNPPPRTVIAYGPSSGFPPHVTVPPPLTTDDLASQIAPNVRSAFAHEAMQQRRSSAGSLQPGLRRRSITGKRWRASPRSNWKPAVRGWHAFLVMIVRGRNPARAELLLPADRRRQRPAQRRLAVGCGVGTPTRDAENRREIARLIFFHPS
jgi:hypothetical protein